MWAFLKRVKGAFCVPISTNSAVLEYASFALAFLVVVIHNMQFLWSSTISNWTALVLEAGIPAIIASDLYAHFGYGHVDNYNKAPAWKKVLFGDGYGFPWRICCAFVLSWLAFSYPASIFIKTFPISAVLFLFVVLFLLKIAPLSPSKEARKKELLRCYEAGIIVYGFVLIPFLMQCFAGVAFLTFARVYFVSILLGLHIFGEIRKQTGDGAGPDTLHSKGWEFTFACFQGIVLMGVVFLYTQCALFYLPVLAILFRTYDKNGNVLRMIFAPVDENKENKQAGRTSTFIMIYVAGSLCYGCLVLFLVPQSFGAKVFGNIFAGSFLFSMYAYLKICFLEDSLPKKFVNTFSPPNLRRVAIVLHAIGLTVSLCISVVFWVHLGLVMCLGSYIWKSQRDVHSKAQTNMSMKDAKKELANLKDQQLCVVCQDHVREIVLNCGHYKYCKSCADLITHCSICRQSISERKVVFD